MPNSQQKKTYFDELNKKLQNISVCGFFGELVVNFKLSEPKNAQIIEFVHYTSGYFFPATVKKLPICGIRGGVNVLF